MRPLERFSGSSREWPGEDIRQRLRDLPQELQPPYDWAEFRRRERQHPWPRRNVVRWEHAAVAAGITVLVASMAMWGRASHQQSDIAPSGVATVPLTASNGTTPQNSVPTPASGRHADSVEPLNAVAQAVVNQTSVTVQAAVAAQIAALARTPASKRWLAQQPAEPAVVRVGQHLAVANLEDRIAWVDDALTDAQFGKVSVAGLQALRQERVRLVGSLAQVRYAETLAAQVP